MMYNHRHVQDQPNSGAYQNVTLDDRYELKVLLISQQGIVGGNLIWPETPE